MSWTDALQPRPPRRRYPFWARRDRRRTAQALAAGRDAAGVAALNRVSVHEVERLLDDDEFAELIRHYRRIEALPRAARIAELAEAALRMLELAVETGDLRVCAFVLDETRAGRDPGHTVAEAAVRRIEAASERATAYPVPCVRPRPPAPALPSGDWRHCAATRESEAEAEALAVRDLRDVGAAMRRILRRLADRLLTETERAGTASDAKVAAGGEAAVRQAARHYHRRPSQSLAAAAALQERRERAAAGDPIALWRQGQGPPDG